ncbi:hypothetical protein Tco_1044012 [Tanacetum coccineum]|uniref:Uncharacterized protein n=1 Tax=Tanacetum coccineum TaxID=301880 RepID=A0ABQ5GQX7_9ASTR
MFNIQTEKHHDSFIQITMVIFYYSYAFSLLRPKGTMVPIDALNIGLGGVLKVTCCFLGKGVGTALLTLLCGGMYLGLMAYIPGAMDPTFNILLMYDLSLQVSSDESSSSLEADPLKHVNSNIALDAVELRIITNPLGLKTFLYSLKTNL